MFVLSLMLVKRTLSEKIAGKANTPAENKQECQWVVNLLTPACKFQWSFLKMISFDSSCSTLSNSSGSAQSGVFSIFSDFFKNILCVRFICLADKANTQQENVGKANTLAILAGGNLFKSISFISAFQNQNWLWWPLTNLSRTFRSTTNQRFKKN